MVPQVLAIVAVVILALGGAVFHSSSKSNVASVASVSETTQTKMTEMDILSSATDTIETVAGSEFVPTTSTSGESHKEQEPSKITDPLKKEVVSPPAQPSETAASKNESSLQEVSEKARAVLVNIKCSSSYHSVGGMTGSGVIIDPRGIVVTNAHVAQYFLIEETVADTDCIIRTGSPAKAAYEAKLIFISPQWMARHALTFSQIWSAVNGDYDYAFLAITKSLTSEPLPAEFPFTTFGNEQVPVGEQVVIAGYAAEFLDEQKIDTELFPTIVFGGVKSVSAFSGSRADLLELGGSNAAQQGSSGGAILNAQGALIGVLAIGSRQKNTESREFAGISADYIRRTYQNEEGKSLDLLLKTDLRTSINAFEWRIAKLADPLLRNINNPNYYYYIDE